MHDILLHHYDVIKCTFYKHYLIHFNKETNNNKKTYDRTNIVFVIISRCFTAMSSKPVIYLPLVLYKSVLGTFFKTMFYLSGLNLWHNQNITSQASELDTLRSSTTKTTQQRQQVIVHSVWARSSIRRRCDLEDARKVIDKAGDHQLKANLH